MREFLGEWEQLRADAFICLSRIESGLRELIRAEAPRLVGPKWRRGLPPDVRERLNESGLDGAYLGDLRKILHRYWSDLTPLSERFRLDDLMTHLNELDDPRNDVAHSRRLDVGSLALIQAAYYMLEPVLLPYLRQEPDDVGGDHAVALVQAHNAALKGAPIPADVLRTLESANSHQVIEAAQAYDRVVRQPGQSPALLGQLRDHLIEAIQGLDTAEADE